MKKIYSKLTIAVIALASVFGFSSCGEAFSDHLDFEPEPETKTEIQQQKSEYNVKGLWRLDLNGEKYSLYVEVPSYDTGGRYCANFYYEGKNCPGTAELRGDIMTFESDSNADDNVVLKATFADNDSQQFTASLTIGNKAVAMGATFKHMEDPSNYIFSISYKVVDPDNELSAMGADIQKLTEEVMTCNNKTETGNRNKGTALASLTALNLVSNIQLARVMQNQCAKYPQLAKSNVYVAIQTVESYGDIDTIYEETSMTYEHMGK